MIDKTEQWLLDGKCDECRRNGYCSTKCKKGRNNYGSGIFMIGPDGKPKKISEEDVKKLTQQS